MRHTFCTRFCENETNVKSIQATMGYANIEITLDIYTDVTERTKEDVMKNLSKQLDLF
jgi:site-specific recombinase XerD